MMPQVSVSSCIHVIKIRGLLDPSKSFPCSFNVRLQIAKLRFVLEPKSMPTGINPLIKAGRRQLEPLTTKHGKQPKNYVYPQSKQPQNKMVFLQKSLAQNSAESGDYV